MNKRQLLQGLFAVSAAAAAGKVLNATPAEAAAGPDLYQIGRKGARGNTEFITENAISVERVPVTVEGTKVDILVFSKKGPNVQPYFIPHDNEVPAFDTALRAIANGGTVITFDSRGERNLAHTDQDPNRMFKEGSKFWPLAQKVSQMIESTPGISSNIALHNNAPIGSFVISLERAKADPNYETFYTDKGYPRDVVWIALPASQKGGSHPLRAMAQQLKERGINALIEYVSATGPTDGSYSQYTARNTAKGYINIEVGIRGNDPDYKQAREAQTLLLDAVNSLLKPQTIASL